MMKKLKAIIKERLFGKTADPVCARPKPGWKTNYHGGYTTFGDWCKQFNVSRLHKRDNVFFD